MGLMALKVTLSLGEAFLAQLSKSLQRIIDSLPTVSIEKAAVASNATELGRNPWLRRGL
jgi:hypothetical protein